MVKDGLEGSEWALRLAVVEMQGVVTNTKLEMGGNEGGEGCSSLNYPRWRCNNEII